MMSFTDFSKKVLMNYFIIVTGVTIVIAVLGMNFSPDMKLGYEAFLSPLIYGAIASLLTYIFYSKKELTFRQMLLRRILHFMLLEIILMGFGYFAGLLDGVGITIMFSISIFAVYLFKMAISWIVDSKTAGDINVGLKRLQE